MDLPNVNLGKRVITVDLTAPPADQTDHIQTFSQYFAHPPEDNFQTHSAKANLVMREDLELFIFGLNMWHLVYVGTVVLASLCLGAMLRSGRLFPRKRLAQFYGLTMVVMYVLPLSAHRYAFSRLTDDDNFLFVDATEIGRSYDVLWVVYHKWSDVQLMIVTGSLFIFSAIIMISAYLLALLLYGLYQLLRRLV